MKKGVAVAILSAVDKAERGPVHADPGRCACCSWPTPPPPRSGAGAANSGCWRPGVGPAAAVRHRARRAGRASAWPPGVAGARLIAGACRRRSACSASPGAGAAGRPGRDRGGHGGGPGPGLAGARERTRSARSGRRCWPSAGPTSPRGVTALAVVNVIRTPGRTLLGAVSLAVGIAALTMLAARHVRVPRGRRRIAARRRGRSAGPRRRLRRGRGDRRARRAGRGRRGVPEHPRAGAPSWPPSAPSAGASRRWPGWWSPKARSSGSPARSLGAGLGLAGGRLVRRRSCPPGCWSSPLPQWRPGSLVTAAAALLPAALLRRLPTAQLLAEE